MLNKKLINNVSFVVVGGWISIFRLEIGIKWRFFQTCVGSKVTHLRDFFGLLCDSKSLMEDGWLVLEGCMLYQRSLTNTRSGKLFLKQIVIFSFKSYFF